MFCGVAAYKDFVKWVRSPIFHFSGGEESGEGAVVLSVAAVFDAGELLEGGILAGEFGKSGGDTADLVEKVGGVEDVHGFGQQACFHGPDPANAPPRGCHLLDQGEFEIILRLEFGDVLIAEGIEFLLGFAFEDDAVGIEAVGAAVAGRAQLSFGSFGSTGEGPVGSGRPDSNSGRHKHLLASV